KDARLLPEQLADLRGIVGRFEAASDQGEEPVAVPPIAHAAEQLVEGDAALRVALEGRIEGRLAALFVAEVEPQQTRLLPEGAAAPGVVAARAELLARRRLLRAIAGALRGGAQPLPRAEIVLAFGAHFVERHEGLRGVSFDEPGPARERNR